LSSDTALTAFHDAARQSKLIDQAVRDGVDLMARPGTVHVICGENGAGKSTLMEIINGTYVADEGDMYYKGEKIGSHTATMSAGGRSSCPS